ncbi:MAG: glutamate 5-kinase [Gammaproteobacteria bacterium]|nr:glutamate 5-kinase [Gammaproteobacteria bacterium]
MTRSSGKIKRIVVKIGSALITDGGRGLDHEAIAQWAEQIAQLRLSGIDVVLVSSGSIAEGVSRIGLKQRPGSIHTLQAAAAVGQMGLIQSYEASFQKHGLHSAQILLTHDDLANRNRYLNARSTLRTLLDFGTIPVVNENDTVATDEIRFGDNDTLGALVANLIEADLLIILTDQQGLYDDNPAENPNARFIEKADADDDQLMQFASPTGGALGRGGMQTKIIAARKAARSGTHTVIAYGREDDVIKRVVKGESIGTYLKAGKEQMVARKQWLAGHMRCAGELVLDEGAVRVLQKSGASLLPIGVKQVKGDFKRGEVVACVSPQGRIIARGLVNYPADEARKIIGHPSKQIPELLGYEDDEELVHRDNLILLDN